MPDVLDLCLTPGIRIPVFPIRDPESFYHFDSPSLDIHYTEPPTGGHGIWSSLAVANAINLGRGFACSI
jgi:hypothetical protein